MGSRDVPISLRSKYPSNSKFSLKLINEAEEFMSQNYDSAVRIKEPDSGKVKWNEINLLNKLKRGEITEEEFITMFHN